MGDHDDLFPQPDLELLHTREYVVRSYRVDDSTILIRGAVRDRKPPGMYVPGDALPLTVHHMVIDLVVDMPTMAITSAQVVLETHPHEGCRRIEGHYQLLVGLSITRGFTHEVRELFGGPRGCTHTTALLQAMAPVAIQSTWSLSVAAGRDQPVELARRSSQTDVRDRFALNLNTCHVWAQDGEQVAALLAGEELEPPLWIVDRYRELGLDVEEWMRERR